MRLNESGFTFNGLHSRKDMGLIYAEKDGHVITPRIVRNAYEIAGVSGTVLMAGDVRKTIAFDGTLYPAEEHSTQREAQAMLRQVAAWLTAGRRALIFDYEPTVFYMAEVSTSSKWSLKNWFGGELPIQFTAQPWAYNVTADEATGTTAGTTLNLTINVHTGEPAPLALNITNTGGAPVTGVAVRINEDSADSIVMAGMSLLTGQTLAISMEPPVGAQIGAANALPYANTFVPLALASGANTITTRLAYGTGTKGARVTALARGRW